MPLIDCPECGREVSSSASACPECAYPVGSGAPPVPGREDREPASRSGWWSILGRVVAGVFLVGLGVEENEYTGLIGGVIIGGSAIPAWYRDKIERLKAARSMTALDDRLEDRMAELEGRHQDQMAQLERTHTGQLAELEERIDFTERLLTKQSEPQNPV